MSRANRSAEGQALALAGVAQFALYTHELAAEGNERPERLERALHAIFCTEPEHTEEVFDGVAGVADGIAFLKRQLAGGPTDNDAALISRYIGQILRLGGRLRNSPQTLNRIRGAIERARLADPRNAPGILAEAYQDTVSHIRPRIMVKGHPSYLGNAGLAEQMRTYLMAAVRCAVMWRQNGGAFWRLLLQRQRLLAALEALSAGQGTVH